MKTFLSFTIAIISYISVFAQVTQTDAQKAYFEMAKSMGLHKDPDYYYQKHVNIAKHKELKEAGFDLFKFDQHAGALTYQEAAAMSDVAVAGTVISKEYDASADAYFHSIYKVKVETVVKGEKVKSAYVYVYMVSGMLNDKSYVYKSEEPELFVGDKVLLFLNYVPFESAEKAKKEGLLTKRMNVDAKDKDFSFVLQAKFSVRSNNIFNEHNSRIEEYDRAIEVIKKINAINVAN